MGEIEWKRARNSEQKDQRINEILDAAAELFHTEPFEKVTMIMIAKEAGFTRSNLYRYFSTKEDIFITLFMSDLKNWKDDLLQELIGSETLEQFVEKWTDVLMKQHRLLELSPLLTLNLEKNTSEKIYREIKIVMVEQMEDVISIVSKIIPGLSDEKIYKLLFTHQVLAAGLYPMCQYSEMQTKVLNDLNLDFMKLDFSSFYSETLHLYLKGLLS